MTTRVLALALALPLAAVAAPARPGAARARTDKHPAVAAKKAGKTDKIQERSPQVARGGKIQERSPPKTARNDKSQERSSQVGRSDKSQERSSQVGRSDKIQDRSPQVARGGNIQDRSPQVARSNKIQDRSPQVARGGNIQERSPQVVRNDKGQRLVAARAVHRDVRPTLPPLAIARPVAQRAAAEAPERAVTQRPAKQPAVAQRPAKERPPVTKPRAPRWPAVTLVGPNVRETLAFRPFDEKGRTRTAAIKELTSFLRDYHTGKRHKLDPRLGRVIYEIARHFNRPLEVYSGYRPPQYSSRAHSRHLTGAAIDFAIPGVANEAIIKYLRATFHPAGVGYYPNGVHVHVDVDRTEDTYWVDRGDPPPPPPALAAAVASAAPALPPAPPPVDAERDEHADGHTDDDEDDGPGLHGTHEGPEIDPCFLR